MRTFDRIKIFFFSIYPYPIFSITTAHTAAGEGTSPPGLGVFAAGAEAVAAAEEAYQRGVRLSGRSFEASGRQAGAESASKP
jgi:hypothetical protein